MNTDFTPSGISVTHIRSFCRTVRYTLQPNFPLRKETHSVSEMKDFEYHMVQKLS